MSDTLTRLAQVLEERKGAAADSSYVASLYHKGLNKILEKVGEESVETIIVSFSGVRNGDDTSVAIIVAPTGRYWRSGVETKV